MPTKATNVLPFRSYLPAPELSFYRKTTTQMLRRYFRMSMAVGRVPSIMGREVFRAKLSRPRMTGFEDVVIFVTDVEHCLARLEEFPQQLIARCILQEHPWDDAAVLIGCSKNSIWRHLPEALDQLTEVFLSVGLLKFEPSVIQSQEENA